MKRWRAVLATVACCACGRLPKRALAIRFRTGEWFRRGAEPTRKNRAGSRHAGAGQAGLESGGDKSGNGGEKAGIPGRLPRRKREWSMKILNKPVVLTAILVAALALISAPRAAAQTGTISGQVLDINAKPWVGLTIEATSDQGAKSTAKTDNDGKYSIARTCPLIV